MPRPYLLPVKKPTPKSIPQLSNNLFLEPVEVYGRLRPLKDLNDKEIVTKIDDQSLEVASSSQLTKYRFKFKHVFDYNCSQGEVFNHVALPLVNDLIHGKNGLIFSYGASGSGKTYTIAGNPQDCGLLPRVLDMIFNTLDRNNLQSVPYIFKPDGHNSFDIISAPDAVQKIQENLMEYQMFSPQKKSYKNDSEMSEWMNRIKEDSFVKDINCDLSYGVFVTYIEIYNNSIYDLLDDQSLDSTNGTTAVRSKLRIIEDMNKRYYVQEVKELEVRSADDACELFIKGMNRRKTGVTQINNESSRSHSIFTIRIVQAPLDIEGVLPIDNKKLIHVGQLSIVDLAGCERISRTKVSGDRMKETNNINTSLLTLRKCFDVLRENQKKGIKTLVPYRDSKLTHLFKNYFEGDGRVKMMICINPGLDGYDETIQVCKFAETSQELLTNQTEIVRHPCRMIKTLESHVDYASMIFPIITFPDEFLTNPEDTEIISKWSQSLEQQCENYTNYVKINKQNQLKIRDQIIQIENELTMLRQENRSIKADLEYREIQLDDYETKFTKMEQEIEVAEVKMKKFMKENSRLEHQVNLLKTTLIKVQQDYNKFYQQLFQVFEKEKEMKTKSPTEPFEGKLKEKKQNKNECFQKDTQFPETLRLLLSLPKLDLLSLETKRSQNVSINKSKIQDLKRSPISAKVYQIVDLGTAPPVINPKYRRSFSSNADKWIDHKPMKTLELGTVFQPNIKNKKSVTKLKASDFVNRKNGASKYVLTHHEATESGMVETKIFKGDVIPSSAGGAQIIFKDVEMLKQESPNKIFV